MRRIDHQGMPWIQLPESAQPPQLGQPLSPGERRLLEERIAECAGANANLVRRSRRRDSPSAATPRAIRQAWRRFFLSHFCFFFNFALLAECYDRLLEELIERGDVADELVERACGLWRASGALMMYGVDFAPTEEIYGCHIRPFMAEGLSGTWLREYQRVNRGRRAWRSRVGDGLGLRGRLAGFNARLLEAEKCYHRRHVQVMQTCVPDMVSKLQDYQALHGPVEVSAGHFEIYDRWFHVARVKQVDPAAYLRTACAVATEVIGDFAAEETGLSEETLADLAHGISIVLEILAERLAGNAVMVLDESWRSDEVAL